MSEMMKFLTKEKPENPLLQQVNTYKVYLSSTTPYIDIKLSVYMLGITSYTNQEALYEEGY